MTDKQQLLEAFRSAKGIVDHEFSQEVMVILVGQMMKQDSNAS
jgi:hypothetical protein